MCIQIWTLGNWSMSTRMLCSKKIGNIILTYFKLTKMFIGNTIIITCFFSHKMEKLIPVFRHDCGIYVTKYMELWNDTTLTKSIVAITVL